MSAVPLTLTVAMLWGLSPVIYKHVMHTIDPKVVMVLGGAVYACCLALFAAWHWSTIRSNMATHMTWPLMRWIVLTAVVTMFSANVIYFYVLDRHDSHLVTALIASSPVFTLGLAYLFLQEKVHALSVAGLALIVAGVVCLAFNGDAAH